MSVPEDWVMITDFFGPWQADEYGVWVYKQLFTVYLYGKVFVPANSTTWKGEIRMFNLWEAYRPQHITVLPIGKVNMCSAAAFIKILPTGVCKIVGSYNKGEIIDLNCSFFIYDY